MKVFILTFVNVFFINFLIGQNIDNSFTKIKTDNWVELSVKLIDDVGEEMPFTCEEEIPEFPGGYDSLANFLTAILKYPESAINDSVQGCVYTSFIVEKNGEITNIVTYRGIREDLNSACIKAVSLFPRWTRKKQSGKAPRVQFTLPVRFVLE